MDPIDLAQAAPFQLGPLRVEPALRQVSAAVSETLEPRVMQVLVALARAEGQVVSRDELIRQCWDNRIVGDDAINRVIGRLRRLAAERGDGTFAIETVVKVGYRLTGVAALPLTPAPGAARILSGPTLDQAESATDPTMQGTARTAPRRGRWLAAGGATLTLTLAAAVWVGVHREPLDAPKRLVLAPIAVGPGLPTHFADDLRDAVAATLPPASFVVSRDSRPDDGALRLTGHAERDGNGVILAVALRLPGNPEPAWTAQLTRPDARVAPRDFAPQIAATIDCMAEGITLPAARQPLWTAVCTADDGEPLGLIDRLRAVVKAAPDFVPGKIMLAETLGEVGLSDPGGVAARRAEGEPLARSVLATDPRNSAAWNALAQLRPPLDFAGREALFQKAIAAHPTACGCEHQTYSYLLSMAGRGRDAEREIRRTVDLAPNSPFGRWRLAETIAVNGAYGTAATMLGTLAAQWPTMTYITALRYKTATFARDWPTAATMLASEGDNPSRRIRADLIAALAAGDAARVAAAGEGMRQLVEQPQYLRRSNVAALALAGMDDAAVAAAGRMVARTPGFLTVVFEPPFARARATPAFATLATRLGLIAYWQKSGHAPDFCLAAAPPALCARLPRGG